MDPIGMASGDTNSFRYVSNRPLLFTDPSGLAGGNRGQLARCQFLFRKIAKLEERLAVKTCNYAEDKLDLANSPDGPDVPHKDSRSKHAQHIKETQENLNRYREEYDRDCGGGGDGSAQGAPSEKEVEVTPPDPNGAAAIGAGAILWWLWWSNPLIN